MEIFIIIMLSAAVCVLAARLFFLKRRIGSVSRQLDDGENNLITTQLGGDELEAVVKKINIMMESERRAKTAVKQEQAALRQAIADISHDIRTPLTSVVGYLQLAERSAESAEQRASIGVALERARYCSDLVGDFFELSVIDSGGCEPVMEKVDVTDMLCELILANAPSFDAAGITPRFEGGGAPIYAQADRKMLSRVMQNLISNGIKYGGGELELSITACGTVSISVSNPLTHDAPDTERMFDKFYRAGKARGSGGAGIGLYICKQLTEAMGGSISAAAENGRLTVTLRLRGCVS